MEARRARWTEGENRVTSTGVARVNKSMATEELFLFRGRTRVTRTKVIVLESDRTDATCFFMFEDFLWGTAEQ